MHLPSAQQPPCTPTDLIPTKHIRAGATAAEKGKLEAYLTEHQIQDNLSVMLNEMARLRPNAPYGWLARRMRKDALGHSPAVGTIPVLPAAAKGAIGGDLEKRWGFVLGLQGQASVPAPAAKSAAKPQSTGASNVQLTIEAFGDGVLLAIRPDK